MVPLFYLTLLCSFVISQDIISSETTILGGKKSEKHEHNEYRRFYQDLEGEEWHIAHVKDMLLRRSSCPGETFQDRVAKYRRSLNEDGGRVQFVSPDPLPVDQAQLKQNDYCKDNFTNVFIKPNSLKNIKRNLTVEENKSLNDTDGKSNGTQSRKSGDYVFSHEEYYDEEVEFKGHTCPTGVITVIELMLDQLKPYDVECSLAVEWQSLEDPRYIDQDTFVPVSKD